MNPVLSAPMGTNVQGLITGVVSGIVTNNKDPEKLGRVRVLIPRISGEDESAWARVATFMAGPDRGSFFLPEIDDEVLISFEYGDINMPYVIGALWNGVDKPPEANEDGNNDIRVIKSRSGHSIQFIDTDGEEKVIIQGKGETDVITINVAENTIEIKAKTELKLTVPDGKCTIDAKEGEFTFSDALTIKSKELNLETEAALNVKSGADLAIEASGNLDAKGATINLN